MTQANQVTHQDALLLARKHHLSGNLNLAHQVYLDILNSVPDDFASLHYISVIEYQRGEFEEALEHIERAIEQEKGNQDTWNIYGVILGELGRHAEAIEKWEKALKIDPDFAQVYSNMGNAYWMLGQYEKAKESCLKGIEIEPEEQGCLTNLGNAYAKLEQQEKAIECWEKVIATNPENVGALSNITNAYNELEQYKKANEYGTKALEISPENPQALLNFANSERALGNSKKAEEIYRKLTNIKPDYAQAHFNLAMALIDQVKYDEAITSLKYAVSFDKNNVEFLSNLAVALSETNNLLEAEKMAQRAIKVSPESAEAHIDLADILFKMDKLADAEALFEKAIELAPPTSRVYLKFANVLEKLNRIDDALEYVDKALEINKDSPEIYHRKAMILYMANIMDDALELLEKALKIKPDFAAAIATKSEILQSLNRKDEAIDCARKAIEINPNLPYLYYTLSKLKKFKADDPEFKQMKELQDKISKHGEQQAVGLNFALFKAYEDIKDYKNSFQYLKKGNDIKFSSVPFSPKEQRTGFKNIEVIWTPKNLQRFKGTGIKDETPIFIVGMPRSGTTLTEQIISSHPDVFGAGELHHLSTIEKDYNMLSEDNMKEIGQRYIDEIRKISEESKTAKRITDKMPGNYTKIGLIACAMPNAKIIHTRRHPIDTCLSCYKQLFARGHSWSYNMKAMAEHYELYMETLAYWREHLPDRFLEINYEDTVGDFENQARKLIDFAGLEWDDACLTPHKQKRAVLTASKNQVTKPIYQTSVEAWKRYEEPLKELADPLKKFITEDGKQKVV